MNFVLFQAPKAAPRIKPGKQWKYFSVHNRVAFTSLILVGLHVAVPLRPGSNAALFMSRT